MTGKRFFLLVVAGFLAVNFALSAEPPKIVDFEADVMRPIPIGDSSALSLVGHVVFYHNGAVITCDSAVRYNDRRMDCFNHVVINQDSTYVYGDRADYDGMTNTARVYAPLVKMVDKDAVLYTYNFSFNTLDNIGRYSGGGTLLQKDNLLESKDGYYYTKTRDLIGVNDVEMHSKEYEIKSDSITYNLDTEIASFYTRSYVWNDQDQLLTARRGMYDRKAEQYTFTDSSYILTKNQELWADTIVYHQPTENALLLQNVQIVDDEQKAMAFGDFAQYWGGEKKALLTRNPSVLSFDGGTEEAPADTLFMRSDSIYIYTVNRFDVPADSAAAVTDSLPDHVLTIPSMPKMPGDTTGTEDHFPSDSLSADSVQPDLELPASASETADTTVSAAADTLSAAPPEPKVLSKKELKQKAAEEKRQAKIRERKEKEEARLREVEEATGKGVTDSTAAVPADTSDIKAIPAADSAGHSPAQELPAMLGGAKQDSVQQDSMVRIVRAYFNVKMFRSDFQAVCDSLVGFSVDSTIHMYIDPVMWNENNQVKSQTIDIFTKKQTIDKAVFKGDPIMSAQVDTAHYNQVTGKIIEAYFREGQIWKTDVLGSGQTYYYLEDGDSTDRYISGFLEATCADITFYFKDKQVDKIVYKGEPVYSISPMDKIPPDQPQFLKGFVWEADRKPTKKEVFDRPVRSSLRTEYETMGRPTYPITQRINHEKERLVKEGVWVDRSDKVNEEALEFINSLGYE